MIVYYVRSLHDDLVNVADPLTLMRSQHELARFESFQALYHEIGEWLRDASLLSSHRYEMNPSYDKYCGNDRVLVLS